MSIQYDLYLQEHRNNVAKGFYWLRDNLPWVLHDDYEHQIVYGHDQSKDHPDEYEAYDRYFYGNNKSYAVVQDFNKAWLTHIHRNPHHWQHWVLINDDPKEGEKILNMPHGDIIEMICDWWAFSWKQENLFEIFNWYDEHKDYIKLSSSTRKTLESILEQIKEKLMKDGENYTK